jgi:hypothetical protein
MVKSKRYECLFCSSYEGCRRLEVNELIIREIKKTGHCPDRREIWINPSTRSSYFFFLTDKSFQVLGEEESRCPNKYFRPTLKEIKEYVE